jgi:multidrug resistance efflux pump
MSDTPTQLPKSIRNCPPIARLAGRCGSSAWPSRWQLRSWPGLAWYVLVARNYVSTDNAYVNAQMAQVTPLVAGSAIEVLVEDTQQVKAGDVLVRLDQANAKIAVAQAEADLAAARRKFGQTVATNSALSAQIDTSSAGLVQAQARLRTAQAEFEKARIDLQRREAVIASGAISGEDLTQARKAYAAASRCARSSTWRHLGSRFGPPGRARPTRGQRCPGARL